MNEDEEIEIDVAGKVSKVDKWNYNDTLNVLAKNALFTKKTMPFGYWVDRLVTALKIVNVKNLPLKKMLNDQEEIFRDGYYLKLDELKKNYEIWYDPLKRKIQLDKWEQIYYETLFDYALELATQAGFTIHLDSIDEGIAMRG